MLWRKPSSPSGFGGVKLVEGSGLVGLVSGIFPGTGPYMVLSLSVLLLPGESAGASCLARKHPLVIAASRRVTRIWHTVCRGRKVRIINWIVVF